MRRLLTAGLALACMASQAMGQSSAGGGGGSSGGGPATQSGAWNVGLTGTLPAFAQTPTFNVGTIAGIATETGVQQVRTALGSPFQAGGSIGNAAFGISGALPAFAATPTFNLGTLNGAATAVNQSSEISLLTAANQRTAYFSEANNAAVASGASVGGASPRDAGSSPSAYTRVNGYFYSTQTGTATILGSDDGSNFFTVYNQAMAAGTPYFATGLPVVFRYYYLKVTNGATAATVTVKGSFTVN